MSKGGGEERTVTQTTDSSPWGPQQPFLQQGFQEAKNLFESDQPQFYPGNTHVPFSPETEQSLTQIRDRALQGSPVQTAGQGAALDTLQGKFLGGNPFFQGAFDAQVRPAVEQYQNQTVPGIDSGFASAGRYGSQGRLQMQDQANKNFSRALSDTAGSLAYQNYDAERGRQQAMIPQASTIAQADYLDPQNLLAVGGAREGLGQDQLSDELNRFNFEQNIRQNKLANYMGLVGGGFGGSSTQTQPVFSNRGSSMLGGGLSGGALASMMGAGPFGIGLGALGGAFMGR